ncbi:MAG: hypothetical protein HC913_12840 [Microscillaceae bacterium]|nr:hypothetical protein [Microscillaceae bacterium]
MQRLPPHLPLVDKKGPSPRKIYFYVEADKLRSARSKCNISGSGRIVLVAEEMLEAKVSETGNILYEGQPAQYKTHVLGSGRISPCPPPRAIGLRTIKFPVQPSLAFFHEFGFDK